MDDGPVRRRCAATAALVTALVSALLPPALPMMTNPDDVRATGQRASEFIAFTYPFNMSGQPAVSVPMHEANGLPIGVQLVAAPGREDVLLAVASQLEQCVPWTSRLPAVCATT
jgi:amidase